VSPTATTRNSSNPPSTATEQQPGDTLPEHPTVHLDSVCNGKACAAVLDAHEYHAVIAAKGVKAPIQAGKRWPVERTKCATRRSVCIPGSAGRNSEGGSWAE
jgi:hypothetical protein